LAKNILIALLAVIVAVFITLIVSERLQWIPQNNLGRETPEVVLAKAIEMHRPEVLKIGDQELLHIPTSKMSGKNWSVNNAFYILENGTLKKVDLK